ncbi:MAG TPA: hypothetical protein VHC70_07655 [Phycisphaerales bacterium]|jgi:hypothetical protein|nr:hypothetical protein [Phycisphaerales bacterium]
MCCAALFASASVSLGANGVCCIPNLTCAIDSPTHCAATGGSYKGDNTTCQPTNPCEPPRGACCILRSIVTVPSYSSGGGPAIPCFMWVNRQSRNSRGPTQRGANGNCLPICTKTLGPIDTAGPVNWGEDPLVCIVIPEINCTSNDGVYHGDGSACTVNLCAPPETILGACCILGVNGAAQCVSRIAADCTIGTFTPTAACDPSPCTGAVLGACCRVDYCFTTTSINCLASHADYRGDGSTCSTTCPTPVLGSCCRAGSATRGVWCETAYNVGCTAAGEVFTAGQSCSPSALCNGACPCDWNQDGLVNGADLVQFTSDWLAGHGDFDHSMTTDQADYTAFTQCYSGPATSACIH